MPGLRAALHAATQRRLTLHGACSGDRNDPHDPPARPIKPVYIRRLVQLIDRVKAETRHR